MNEEFKNYDERFKSDYKRPRKPEPDEDYEYLKQLDKMIDDELRAMTDEQESVCE